MFASQEIIIPTFFALFNPNENESIRCGVDDDFKVSLFATKNIIDRVGDNQVGYVYVLRKEDFKHKEHYEWISHKPVMPLHIVEVYKKDIKTEIIEIR